MTNDLLPDEITLYRVDVPEFGNLMTFVAPLHGEYISATYTRTPNKSAEVDLPALKLAFKKYVEDEDGEPIDFKDRYIQGANPTRIKELADKWKCNDEDAMKYADYLGVTLQMDGGSWVATAPGFVNLQESPAGYGDTCLQALSGLCSELGYTGGKMWNATFESLLKQQPQRLRALEERK